jgi:thiol-disulfide isomerase/thioredoxin
MGTYVHTQHDDFDDVVGRGAIPILHDQNLIVTETRLSLDAGLTAKFGANLVVPLRIVSTSIVYRDGMGSEVQLVTPSTHHRNETLTGIGDPMLLGSFVASRYLTLRAGLTVPLGRTEEDPFANADVRHQHIQMGTGTVNPVFAAEASYPWELWRFGGYGFTQQIIYENGKGYQAGDRYAGGVFARRSFGDFGARAGIDVQGETRERWNGVSHTDEGNQGRIDAMVALGGTWAATDRISLDATIKVPFVTHVVGGQLDMPALVEVGVAYRFGKAPERGHVHDGDDHDHAHEHGDEHDEDRHGEGGHEHGDEHGHDRHDEHPKLDTTGADFADLGPPGAAVDLVPVRGKLTIFEFGATWCEPCKTLEPVLVELAKKYPDRVAVRRIDVVDWDSAVANKYLAPKAFDLPHVKVYDATGKLLLERSSAPGKLGALIDDIRALVEPPSTKKPPPPAAKAYRVQIEVTEKGFTPNEVKVPRDRPVVLVFTRKTEKTCATDLVLPGGTVKDLPMNKPVEIPVTFTTPGPVGYACSMNMIKGTIIVQ